MRPLSSQVIRTKPTSSPTCSYSTLPSVSISLQLSLGSSSIALFPFLNMYLRRKPSFSFVSRPYAVSLLPYVTLLRTLSLLYKAFLRLLLTYVSPGWFPFLSVTNINKLKRIHRSLVASSSAVSRPPLFHFFSLRRLYLPYELS